MAGGVDTFGWRRQASHRETVREIKSVHGPEIAAALTALSEAIQLLQSRDLEKEQRIASIEARLERANAILKGAA